MATERTTSKSGARRRISTLVASALLLAAGGSIITTQEANAAVLPPRAAGTQPELPAAYGQRDDPLPVLIPYSQGPRVGGEELDPDVDETALEGKRDAPEAAGERSLIAGEELPRQPAGGGACEAAPGRVAGRARAGARVQAGVGAVVHAVDDTSLLAAREPELDGVDHAPARQLEGDQVVAPKRLVHERVGRGSDAAAKDVSPGSSVLPSTGGAAEARTSPPAARAESGSTGGVAATSAAPVWPTLLPGSDVGRGGGSAANSPMIEPILSRLGDPEGMSEKLQIDSGALMREIAGYLAAVDAFRAESCEPTWHPEPASGGPVARGIEAHAKSASASGS